MNAIALKTQGGSGEMVEYLLPNLKVEGSRPPCAQILFRYSARKLWCRKLNRKFRPTCQKLFCSMYEMSQRHPVWVAENHVTACNSAAHTMDAAILKGPCTGRLFSPSEGNFPPYRNFFRPFAYSSGQSFPIKSLTFLGHFPIP
jgi:hypothetical protein